MDFEYVQKYYESFYEIGNGNYDGAEKIYRNGMKNNIREAFLDLAVFYYYYKQENEKAEEMFKTAFKKGNYRAAYYLGKIAKEKNDFKEAKKWYLKGAKRGDGLSALELGKMLKAENNIKEAKKWLLMAARQKDGQAIIKLISIYCLENDRKKMYELKRTLETEVGIEKIDYNVLLILDCIFEYENKIELFKILDKCDDLITLGKYSEAEKLYLDNLKYNEIYYYLGNLYQFKFKNIEKAKEQYKIGYKKGIAENAYQMGECLYNETEKNIEKAKEWYLKGSKMNNASSNTALGLLLKKEGKNKEAYSYFYEAARERNAIALENIAMYYLENKYYKDAIDWSDYLLGTPKLTDLTNEIKFFTEKVVKRDSEIYLKRKEKENLMN